MSDYLETRQLAERLIERLEAGEDRAALRRQVYQEGLIEALIYLRLDTTAAALDRLLNE